MIAELILPGKTYRAGSMRVIALAKPESHGALEFVRCRETWGAQETRRYAVQILEPDDLAFFCHGLLQAFWVADWRRLLGLPNPV